MQLKIIDNQVKLGNRNIGYLKDKMFISMRCIEKHLYRYLNAWCFNSEVFKLDLNYFMIKTDNKSYGIKISKVKRFRKKFNTYITYAKKSEKQIAIPIILFNEKDEHGIIEKGITIEKFINLIQDERNVYGNWKERNRLQWTQSFNF